MPRAKPTVYNGTRYRSGFEAAVARSTHERGLEASYESLSIPYYTAHVYIPDWDLGNGILVEAKGRFTSPDRTKILSVIKEIKGDGYELRLLFQRASAKLYRGSRTTYGQWATQHGIKWATGTTIPASWFKEKKTR